MFTKHVVSKNLSNFPLDSWSTVMVLCRKQSGYRIAGNFWGRRLSQIGEKHDFCGENFHGLLVFAAPKDTPHSQILRRKLSWIATKPQNSWKFFPTAHQTISPWKRVGCGDEKPAVVIVPCPSPCAPPGEKQSGERNWISWAYSPKWWKTNEIVRSLIIT